MSDTPSQIAVPDRSQHDPRANQLLAHGARVTATVVARRRSTDSRPELPLMMRGYPSLPAGYTARTGCADEEICTDDGGYSGQRPDA